MIWRAIRHGDHGEERRDHHEQHRTEVREGHLGQPAEWCDYSGTVDGRRIGLTLMADPKNFRPGWWHNRDYGVCVANPFGRDAMKQGAKSAVTVKRGEDFHLRFGAAIHSSAEFNPAAAAYREHFQSIAGDPVR